MLILSQSSLVTINLGLIKLNIFFKIFTQQIGVKIRIFN